MSVSLSCEEVRELLPEYAEPGPRPAGPVEIHVASCERCSADLAGYREVLGGLAAFREVEELPPPGFLERTLAALPRTSRARLALGDLRTVPGRVAASVKRRPAASAITGAALGAAALGLIAWRISRRSSRVAGLVS